MATITSAQSGLHSAVSTWVGGVVPVLGDKAIIDHVVEYQGNWSVGDDTSTGVHVRTGRLRASRTATSLLTVRGDLYVDPLLGGTLDLGTEADPIPASVTATIVLNDSAVMGHNKWGLRTNEASGVWTGGVWLWGFAKRPHTVLSAAAASTDTVLSLEDATGWAVGDWLGFQPATSFAVLYRQITSISGNQATVGASLASARASGMGVLNVTRNVKVLGAQGAAYRSHVSLRSNPTAHVTGSAGVELGPSEIRVVGGSTNTWQQAGLNVHPQGNTNPYRWVRKIDGPCVTSVQSIDGTTVVHAPGNPVGINFFNGQATYYEAVSIFAALPGNTGATLQYYSGASVSAGPDSVLLGGNSGIALGYSQGPVACGFRGQVWGATALLSGTGTSVSFDGAKLDPGVRLANLSAMGTVVLRNTEVATRTAVNVAGDAVLWPIGALAPIEAINCTFGPSFGVTRAAMASAHPSNSFTVLQKNGDPTVSERYSPGGRVHRDATRTRRSTASICLASWHSTNPLSMPLTAKVPAGDTLRIKGSVWIEASYLPGDAPAVSLTGTGLSAVTWSAPAVANAWHDFDLSITNSNAAPTEITTTLTARSNANTETARIWVDGLFSDPWSGAVRHHGFQWLAQTSLVPDARITLTEAAALALPVAVNHVAQTITVSGPVTAAQLFQAVMADLAQTANIARAMHITSADGSSFETSYTVVLSGTGVVTGAYADAEGRHVAISAPALLSGTRVQLFDLSGSAEIYNGVLAADGLVQPVTWSADRVIRLRADHPDKVGLQTLGVLTSSGLSFLDVQEDDTVYMDNAIDGATCTEYLADGTDVQVDINDVDGITSVQRLYAWSQWYQTTAVGIASDFFGAITALDAATYLIDQSLADIHLDNVSPAPVRVVGGYLARRDGSTVIAAGSGSIQMDPGKAYVATLGGGLATSAQVAALGTPLQAADYTAPVSAAALQGAVRAELAPELARLDVAVSTRLAGADYTAPPGAAPTLAQIGAAVAAEIDAADLATVAHLAVLPAPLSAAQTQGAVRAELAPELARLDVAVSTRLAAAAYTAPPDAAPTLAQIGEAVALELDAAELATGAQVAALGTPLQAADYTAPTAAGITPEQAAQLDAVQTVVALIPALL